MCTVCFQARSKFNEVTQGKSVKSKDENKLWECEKVYFRISLTLKEGLD